MLHYFTINTTVEAICFLVAICCLRKDKSFVWRSMILFLLITCIAEMAGIYVKRLYIADKIHVHPNAWVYNILIFFQIGFFSLMYQHLLSKSANSKPAIIGGFVLLVLLHVFEIFSHSIFVYDVWSNTAMSILLVLYSLYFYYYLLKDDGYLNLKNSSAFWWVAGTLFFYFGTTAYNFFYEKLSSIVLSNKGDVIYLKYLHNTFNILMYGCWSYAFICRKWLTKKSEIY
ncbi:MAG: hypothetical protein ACXVB0_23310 [Mucilaginibacter sp.]